MLSQRWLRLVVLSAAAVVSVVLLDAGVAFASRHTYYVAPGGGASSCGANSSSNPFATVQAALGCAVDGDMVLLASNGSAAPYPGIGSVAHNVTIAAGSGANARSVTIDVSPTPGPLVVEAGVSVTVKGVTLACEVGMASSPHACGPDVTNDGTLTLSGDTVTGGFTFPGVENIATGSIPANLTVAGSTISGNQFSQTEGGGILSRGASGATAAPSLTVVNSTITGNSTLNSSGNGGGGIAADESAGGQESLVSIVNSTISNNATDGGSNGGGIWINPVGVSVHVTNTLIAGNTAGGSGPDCFGALIDGPGGHNLLGNNSGCTGLTNNQNGDQVGSPGSPINPQLGALSNNGGPTNTLALLAGSPAIGAGDAPTCETSPISNRDERGKSRNAALRDVCDIGAYDTGGVPIITAVSPTSGSTAGGESVTISGTNFTGATKVTFGGVAATNVTVVSATKSTVTTPAHAAGTVNVQVVNPEGKSATTKADDYTYS